MGDRWKQSSASFSPGAPCAPLAPNPAARRRLGAGKDRRGVRPAHLLLPSYRTQQPLFFFPYGRGVWGGERVQQNSGALAALCYHSSTPRSAAAPSPVSVPVSCPPAFPAAARPGGAGAALPAGDDSELPLTHLAAALPARLLPVSLPESPRSLSPLPRPRTPSPSAAPAPPRPSASPPGSHAGGRVTSAVRQHSVRVVFLSSVLPTTSCFAAGRLCVCVRGTRSADNPELARPKRWQGQVRSFRCSPRAAERGYCRSLPQGVRRSLSPPAERLRSPKPHFCISFKRCKQNRKASPSCTTVTLQSNFQ